MSNMSFFITFFLFPSFFVTSLINKTKWTYIWNLKHLTSILSNSFFFNWLFQKTHSLLDNSTLLSTFDLSFLDQLPFLRLPFPYFLDLFSSPYFSPLELVKLDEILSFPLSITMSSRASKELCSSSIFMFSHLWILEFPIL